MAVTQTWKGRLQMYSSGPPRENIDKGLPPQREVVRMLLADPRTEVDRPDVYGRTPLSEARARGLPEIVEMIEQAGVYSI